MIAANLGSQAADSTAAVLLFGAGGGMKPREEVKWALVHRLEKQGAAQEEVEEYTHNSSKCEILGCVKALAIEQIELGVILQYYPQFNFSIPRL